MAQIALMTRLTIKRLKENEADAAIMCEVLIHSLGRRAPSFYLAMANEPSIPQTFINLFKCTLSSIQSAQFLPAP
jgi:hypothetical protein